MLTIVGFVIVLGTMIVIHEFGHFSMAKLLGIKVETFSVGFGPRLAGFRKGDTDYRLSAIPLGGYVKMKGENVDEELTGDPDEFSSRPRWQRLLVAIGGPSFNIATAIVIPLAAAMIGVEVQPFETGPAIVGRIQPDSPAAVAGVQPSDRIARFEDKNDPNWRDIFDKMLLNTGSPVSLAVRRGNETIELRIVPAVQEFQGEKNATTGLVPAYPPGPVTIGIVAPDKPAEKAGLRPGDTIVALNGQPVVSFETLAADINKNTNQAVGLTVIRAGKTFEVSVTPVESGGVGKIGFGPALTTVRYGPIESLRYSLQENARIVILTKAAFAQVIAGKRSIRDTLAGPLQIAQASGQVLEQGGPSQLLFFVGFLSLNLGVVNLLPIPVLDGGLILMLFIEFSLSLFGKSFTVRAREKMIQVGFVLLLAIMGFVIFNDISKYVGNWRSGPPVQQAQPAAK